MAGLTIDANLVAVAESEFRMGWDISTRPLRAMLASLPAPCDVLLDCAGLVEALARNTIRRAEDGGFGFAGVDVADGGDLALPIEVANGWDFAVDHDLEGTGDVCTICVKHCGVDAGGKWLIWTFGDDGAEREERLVRSWIRWIKGEVPYVSSLR